MTPSSARRRGRAEKEDLSRGHQAQPPRHQGAAHQGDGLMRRQLDFDHWTDRPARHGASREDRARRRRLDQRRETQGAGRTGKTSGRGHIADGPEQARGRRTLTSGRSTPDPNGVGGRVDARDAPARKASRNREEPIEQRGGHGDPQGGQAPGNRPGGGASPPANPTIRV